MNLPKRKLLSEDLLDKEYERIKALVEKKISESVSLAIQ